MQTSSSMYVSPNFRNPCEQQASLFNHRINATFQALFTHNGIAILDTMLKFEGSFLFKNYL